MPTNSGNLSMVDNMTIVSDFLLYIKFMYPVAILLPGYQREHWSIASRVP